MPNQPVAAVAKSSDEIANDIANAIVEGRLPPGTKLKEEALAKVYSVSRTKIRAALLMLAKDELIEIAPEKGASVSRLSKDEVREIFEVRRILEVALVREFAQKAQSADYRRLDEHMAREREALAARDVRLRAKLLAEFHTLLAEIVGNQVLLNILKKLTARTALTAMRHQSDDGATCSSDEHARIIEAARAGDVERAIEMTLHHLAHVQGDMEDGCAEANRESDLIAALLTC
ncbi:GntR family transcriptional regulator [Noviherbaspirillum cavernae]|uniref:GntR family transcriptional regulator n=1 Tax=Noviherbaspirillum cavernae TaxID=2320862 RepID=A0A418WXQ3_9BURK|nr:GntR family transcriptional regulator [Noviherbaspirillum cavernae]RJG04865.1 GntR family transcriptional regulator [Noviherbaspirillum cavernae]